MKRNLVIITVVCLVLSVGSTIALCKTKDTKKVAGPDKKTGTVLQPGNTELKSKNYRLITGPIGAQQGLIKKDVILKSSNYILIPMESAKDEPVLKSTNYQLIPYTTTFFTK